MRALRFAILLILCLGLVTWAASVIVGQTTRGWFERDIGLRAQLAVRSARHVLLARWREPDPSALQTALAELAHDERIMAVAACTGDGRLLSQTSGYPMEVTCEELASRVTAQDSLLSPGSEWRLWNEVRRIAGGSIQVTAIPVRDQDGPVGFVSLIHDRTFVERREAETLRFILAAFAVLAVAASLLTMFAGRIYWRGWSEEVRRLLRGGEQRPEFQPILRDVRELVDRIVAEKEAETDDGPWTPQRLKQTLLRHLHGEKIVVLANREPYIHERAPDGGVTVVHPASGLVTALEPVLRACSGTWIAHGAGSADRESADSSGHVRVPPGEESYLVRRVWLSEQEEKGYYYGFANEGLWPLCHIAHTRPVFRNEDWSHYQQVNARFADAVCEEVDLDDPIVLVQDYHFALAPRLIREKLPRSTITMFWHIPWPNSQKFGICPWPEQLLEGMLGASILGFHTQSDCNSFLDSVDRFLEARIDREQNAVVQHGRRTLVRPYPISLEWPNRWARGAPAPEECRESARRELGLAPDSLLIVGVDRLDYTKGVEERLLAIERLLERRPDLVGRMSFVQLGAPSRTVIERYRQLNERVDALAERINRRFPGASQPPIVVRRAHHEPPTVFRYYRAADVCYVSSLHDGMNLVAKEFVAARDDEHGVLVLSQFTGAARELTEALIVNPYDLEESSAALALALEMSRDEQRERMRSMRAFVAEFNVYRWAGRMLVDAARLRRRERLAGRLTDRVNGNKEDL